MQRVRKFTLLSVVLVLAMLAAACGSKPQAQPEPPPSTGATQPPAPAPAPAPAPPKEIDRPLYLATAEIRPSAGEWNPLFANNLAQNSMFGQLWMTVGKFNHDSKLEPWLEKSAVMSSDCLKATITLHPQAKWSDGKPLTAHDIEFTLRLRLKPEVGVVNPVSGALGKIIGSKEFHEGKSNTLPGAKVVNDQTIELTFSSKECLFFTTTGLRGVQPKHILEPHWDNIMAAPYWKNPTVTNGPYKFVRLVEDDHVELERWDDWWGNEIYGKPKIKKVFIKQVRDPQVLASQLQAAELHVGNIPASEIERFEKMSSVEVHRRPTLGITSFGLNFRTFTDKRTRQAMAMALDMQEIIDLAHDGLGKPVATTVVGPDWAKNPNVKPYPRDIEKAKALLKESGFDTSRKLQYLTASAADKRPELFQAAMKQIGLDVEIQVLAPGVWRDRLAEGTWDIHSVTGGVLGLDPAINCQYYESNVFYAKTRMAYKNERIDQICAGLVGTVDQNERQKLAHELDAILIDDLPWINIGNLYAVYISDKRLGGYIPTTYHSQHQFDSLINWYWKE